jgi:hypothetical protein
LDLQTNQAQIPGGEYIIKSSVVLFDNNGNQFYEQKLGNVSFIIALDDDLAVSELISPKSAQDKKYPYGAGLVPIEARFKNIGVNPVTSFTAYLTIRDASTGNIVFTDVKQWLPDPTYMYTGDVRTIRFAYFRPNNTGNYTLEITVTLNNARDLDLTNNIFPKPIAGTFYFNVSHEIEASTIEIMNPIPGSNVTVNKALFPAAKFRNEGVSDISDAPARCRITYTPTNTLVYNRTMLIQDIPSGRYNTAIGVFPDEFIPQ